MPSYLSPGVYVEEAPSGPRPIESVGTSVAAFVGFAEKGPFHAPTLVTNWSQFVQTFGDFVDGSYLAHSVYGFFANGGGIAYVVRVGDRAGGADDPEGGGTGGKAGGNRARELPAGEPVALGTFKVAARPGSGADLTVEVADPEGDNPPDDRFTLVVSQGGKQAERFDVSAKKSAKNYVVAQVRDNSALVQVTEGAAASALARPQKQTVALPAAAPAPGAGGTLPAVAGPQEYIGDADARTGFGALEAIDEITMLAVPDLMAAYQQGLIDAEGVKTVQLAMIAHCELMGDRLAVLDPMPEMTPRQVREWRLEGAGYDSKYAALYYPWVKVFDPSTGQNRFMPPSGHVLGVWSRNDTERGVHKAPANEVVRGAVELQTNVTKGEQDLLNPIGVNCIRAFPGRGIRIWGARTLSSDPAWKYVNVRRLFNYLEESVLLGTQWVVFEPNDAYLWSTIRRNISAFLMEEWRRGALFGATAAEAYYVKCDAETNTPQSIDSGQVICEIGVCPVKPAEFVIFRLAQFSDSTSLVNE
ncbi:phage tail sheath subtilisin-like domain-containing protein [Streptomyces sp. TRM 70351]|uniref:phage tail sheath family protein n=1 Tax=Streptomyces sp. TRM 70351 TaxID=3116552 RepID=UPI002E7B4289|nr:phage tail sheath subtilisin-like domain-containing protein [Streptomyces sp. TRM 70351]MEE1927552.1 phage tail sheath subtilisin-like domain-containing protein [Streptomyces sp. TRM 70351]